MYLLVDYPLFYYVESFLSLITVFVLKSTLSNISTATPVFLLVSIYMEYIFLSLYFCFVCFLISTGGSCRQHADNS